MDTPNRSAQGQVIQQGSDPLGSDAAPVNEDSGSALGMQTVEGKSGSVTKLDNVQTDYTDVHAGHAPPYEGPGDLEDGNTGQ